MATAAKPIYQVQVRELVEFAWRRGDLGGGRDFVGPRRALAGIRGHQRIQRSRPAGYQKEVAVAYEIETDEFILRVQGRLDGLWEAAEGVVLEEIKTVQGGWDGQADPLHWDQAKCYGFIHAHDHALEQVTLQLTYLELESGRQTELRQRLGLAKLSAFFAETTASYLAWIGEQHRWRRHRDESLRALAFPFPSYRPGQRELAVAAYRAISAGRRLFLEAPTGIGKTMSVLLPAVKALGEGKLERVFYLTARTVGRAVAEKAVADLRQAGLRLRTLTLTAKEKICVQAGQPCDAATCPLARGYYDRRRDAMRAALGQESITRLILEGVSRQHEVCPFELSLDLSSWADVVICDYNYVFDPKVYLRRHFAEETGDYAFLVDEAHNLVDRAREMFSADLISGEIREVRRAIKARAPRCARALSKLSTALRKVCGSPTLPEAPVRAGGAAMELDLFASKTAHTNGNENVAPAGTEGGIAPLPAVDRSLNRPLACPAEEDGTRISKAFPAELTEPLEEALKEAEGWLARNEPAEFREALLGLYFRLHSFCRTAELYDERYVTLLRPGSSAQVRLFCLDPSFLLRQVLGRGKTAILFSATLTPIDYYRDLLGGSAEDRHLQLPSPFPPENLAVLVQRRILTHFKARTESLNAVTEAIGAVVQERGGNYLVYFPSYAYLNAVQEQFQALYPKVPVLVQRPGMSESEREAFLGAFAAEHEAGLVGFAVTGGIFGEGIDLAGDRLIGAVIVGVGLPQLCVERDLIRDYFQEKTGAGFAYAYTFPGMNRVLQASGRVIRSETDRGVVLLIDSRFGELRYRRLFPSWWQPVSVGKVSEIRAALSRFWRP